METDRDLPGSAPAPAAPPQRDRQWAVLAHLSAFLLYAGIVGGLLGPLVVWLLFRAEMPFVDDQGRETLNFQITIVLSLLALGVVAGAGALTVSIGGYLLVFAAVLLAAIVLAMHLVLTIIAAVQAGEGVAYRYPYCWRLIRPH